MDDDSTKKQVQSSLKYMIRYPADGKLRDAVNETAKLYGQSINTRLLILLQRGLDSENHNLRERLEDGDILFEVMRRFPGSQVFANVQLNADQFAKMSAKQKALEEEHGSDDLNGPEQTYPNEDKYVQKKD